MADRIQLTIKRVPAYEVFAPNGESLGRFVAVAEWQGITKLGRDDTGDYILVDGLLGSLFGLFEETSRQLEMVKATPTLVKMLQQMSPPTGVLTPGKTENNDVATSNKE